MRHFTCTQTQFAAPNSGASGDMVPAEAVSQSALQITRAAIARWSGTGSVAALARDVPRVSPQARWVSQAQCGLAAWIEGGGFSQADDATTDATAQAAAAPLVTPQMYHLPTACPRLASPAVNACVD